MTHRLFLARHPHRLQAKHPLLIEDFLALVRQSKQQCIDAMITMCSDLHQHGMGAPNIKHLGGPFYELKKRTGNGGARVYFFRIPTGFVLFHAECKKEDDASDTLLSDGADIIEALQKGIPSQELLS